MTTATTSRRRWLLAVAILTAMGLYLWADPVTVLRTRRSEQAVKEDPNSGAGLAHSSGFLGTVQARTVDDAALAALLGKTIPRSTEAVVFSVVVDPDGQVSDVRIIEGFLSPEIAARAVQAIEGRKIFQPAPGAASVRTVVTW